jgi:hypothetical protein
MRGIISLLFFIHAGFVLGQQPVIRATIYSQSLPNKYNADSLWMAVRCSLNVEHSWVEIKDFKVGDNHHCVRLFIQTGLKTKKP